MSEARLRAGRGGEALAALALELQGYEILARNLRIADVEVDLVARQGKLLAVVEVKTRRRPLVPAIDALRPLQIQRLRRAAAMLLVSHPEVEAIRLDVVGIDCRADDVWIRHLRGVG